MHRTDTPQGVTRAFPVTREANAPHNARGWSGPRGQGHASAGTPSRTRLRQGRLPGATVRTSWCFVIWHRATPRATQISQIVSVMITVPQLPSHHPAQPQTGNCCKWWLLCRATVGWRMMGIEQLAIVKCATYTTVHDSYTPRDEWPCFLITPSFPVRHSSKSSS